MRQRIYKIIEVAVSGDVASQIYDWFMLFCIFCCVIPLCFKQTNTVFQWIDYITAAIFILDYILRWSTADLKYPDCGKKAFFKYPFTFFAIVDLLSILPSVTVLNAGFKLFRLFRLTKAFKALKVLRYSKSFTLILNVIKREKRPLLAVCILAGGYIILSALILFQVEPDSFSTFFDATYWAVVTLTTVGYGDIYPQSDVGRIVSMVSSFVGIAIVALPTGIITGGYLSELNESGQNSPNSKK